MNRSPFPQPSDLPWWAAIVARPAPCPQYALPATHLYDPFYYQQLSPWPFPRAPWPYESETRAPGTGLIMGPGTPTVTTPCPPPPQPVYIPPPNPFPQASKRPAWAQRALNRGRS